MLDVLTYGLMAAANNPGGSIPTATRDAVRIAFMILMILSAIAMIVIVLMQKGTNDNVGVISGASDTYYGKNKEKGKEGLLKKITFGLFAFILVCSIITFVVGMVQ